MKGSHLYFVDRTQRKVFVFLNKYRHLPSLKKSNERHYISIAHCYSVCLKKKKNITLHKQSPRLIKITYYMGIKTIDHLGEQLQISTMHWHRIPSVFSAWAKTKWLFRFLQLINFQAGLLRMITFSFSMCWVLFSLLVFKE